MQRARDSQKQRVYDAENEYRRKYGCGQVFTSKEDIEAYVDRFVFSTWFRNRFEGPRAVSVGLNAKWQHSTGSRAGVIRISKGSMDEMIVLHELTHVYAVKGEAGHGREFCVRYLRLIRKQWGTEAEKRLKECFKAHKVRFRLKRAVTRVAFAKGVTPPGFAALQRWREEQKLKKQGGAAA